ncbi:MAG: DUF1997 domain-containing protein [Symploca sp. SIO1C4]|uniref:DUF1997 domain-containing protein n=1 Tax=Symploca sp. SIO1C4 TaxID=2607765 RepID=A0A6B3NHK9_9CYAN|nr:DUF1997 domain-containing protein [Symploca sp. SIO1C4]
MHSQFADNRRIELQQAPLNAQPSSANTDDLVVQTPSSAGECTLFHSHFQDCMEMYAGTRQVSAYLDAHQDWFRRCAHPMKAELIGCNSYALLIGRFGALGYEIEPKIGLELLPQNQGIYRIRSIPIPDYAPVGYNVEFDASQSFVEVPTREYFQLKEAESLQLPEAITRIEWTLELSVALNFPKFIKKLPRSLIQSTGDRLLRQIVRQVSRRLTEKVQTDFHDSLGIPIPKRAKTRKA